MARYMKRNNHPCGRHRVRRLMRLMRLVPIYQEPNTSKKHPQHKIWPYLLRKMIIDRPNQVWCADITYIPMRRGFLYLVAIMDWYSRKVLAWRLSNSMDADFCVEALKEALAKHGKPEIFNTDQGSQFTSIEWAAFLKHHNLEHSMSRRGNCHDNAVAESFFNLLKRERIRRRTYKNREEARQDVFDYIEMFYNPKRKHARNGMLSPVEFERQQKVKREGV